MVNSLDNLKSNFFSFFDSNPSEVAQKGVARQAKGICEKAQTEFKRSTPKDDLNEVRRGRQSPPPEGEMKQHVRTEGELQQLASLPHGSREWMLGGETVTVETVKTPSQDVPVTLDKDGKTPVIHFQDLPDAKK